jgi:hypothetical protein
VEVSPPLSYFEIDSKMALPYAGLELSLAEKKNLRLGRSSGAVDACEDSEGSILVNGTKCASS